MSEDGAAYRKGQRAGRVSDDLFTNALRLFLIRAGRDPKMKSKAEERRSGF